jgi:hypothetical protein
MTETLKKQADQKTSLIDRSSISPTAITKKDYFRKGYRCIKYRNQQYAVICHIPLYNPR